MANDPRLNLSVYAQVNVGPVSISIGSGADSCSTNIQDNLTSQLGARVAASLQIPGDVGAFANLQLGQGGGTVGLGLNNLAALSDAIRINGPPTAANPQGLPVSTDPSAGRNFVLGQVGLSPQAISAVGAVNAQVGNNANVHAQVVYDKVAGGTFTSADITTHFSAFHNALQLTSTLHFGNGPPNSGFGSFCGAKPYAIDLINLAPKYKFLFVVQFEFDPEFNNEVMTSIDPAFVIKNSTRPQVEFEHQDVNMYNFRTKVPTKTVYPPMTMKFYDDDHNNAFQLYATYMKLMSPIANVNIESHYIDPLDAYENVGGGMGFEQDKQKMQVNWSRTVGQGYAGSFGPFGRGPDVRNVLRKITIFQVYRQGRMMNVFNFYNPKITSMQLDDLEMATAGEGSEVSLTFSYDSVFVIPGYSIIDDRKYNLAQITNDGFYPFGIEPGTVSRKFNVKDGTRNGGLSLGEDNLLANADTSTNSQFITTPASIANFTPDIPSFSAPLLNTTGPAISAGGQDMSTSLQGAPVGDLGEVTVTGQRNIDPTTGVVPNSADNTGNLGNVLGQVANTLSQSKNAINQTNPSTLAGSAAQQQALKNATGKANTDAVNTSTDFTGGGGTFSGGGASGSF